MNYLKVNIEALSLNQLKKKYPDLFWEQDWYKDEKFVKEKPKAETLYIGDDIYPSSINKTYSEQEKLLSEDEFIPTINQLAQMGIAYHKQTGKKLLINNWLRASNVTASGDRVILYGDPGGFGVGYWDDRAHSGLGVGSARKSLKLESGALEPFEALKIKGEVYELASYGPKYNDGSRQATLRLKK